MTYLYFVAQVLGNRHFLALSLHIRLFSFTSTRIVSTVVPWRSRGENDDFSRRSVKDARNQAIDLPNDGPVELVYSVTLS